MKTRAEDINQRRPKAMPKLPTQKDNMLKIEHYRYKLNANASKYYKKSAKAKFTANIEDVMLSNENWSIYRGRVDKIHHLVRTTDTPEGIIDCHVFIPATGKVVKDFAAAVTIKRKTYYSVEELMRMDRPALSAVCKVLEIPVVNRTNKILIKDILDRNNSSIPRKREKKITVKSPEVSKQEG